MAFPVNKKPLRLAQLVNDMRPRPSRQVLDVPDDDAAGLVVAATMHAAQLKYDTLFSCLGSRRPKDR